MMTDRQTDRHSDTQTDTQTGIINHPVSSQYVVTLTLWCTVVVETSALSIILSS